MSSQPSSREETELSARVQRWIGDDPDRAASAELEALVAARDTAALRARFDGELVFGTAGIRGEIGSGPLEDSRLRKCEYQHVVNGNAVQCSRG